MPQITGAVSWVNAKVEYSTDNNVWNDISGAQNSLKVNPGTRKTGEAYTSLGDTAIITSGTRDLVAPSSAPDWDVAKGWQGGATTQYFQLVGCRPTEVWSMLIQFKNAASTSQQFCGAENQAALGPNGFSMNNTGSFQAMIN